MTALSEGHFSATGITLFNSSADVTIIFDSVSQIA